LKKFIPPAVLNLLLALGKSVSGFTGPIGSWEKGLRNGFGYDNPKLHNQPALDPREEITETELSSREIRLAFAIQTALRGLPLGQKIKILDLGGAGGQHYKLFSKLIGRENLIYIIVESEPMVQKYQQFSNESLKWATQIPDDVFDITLCSASIQYTQQPLELLEKIVESSSFIILDRLSVSDRPEHVLMRQNFWSRPTGRVSYPCWYFSETCLKEFLGKECKTLWQWTVPEDSPWVFGKRRSNIGLLLQSSNRD
jgi:putative methyltransferase (TIGR04325 family)